MKKQIFIGLACLTAGIGLAGCGASNNQPVETTTSETTAAETTTTTAETTTTTAETTTAETTTTTEAPTTTSETTAANSSEDSYGWILDKYRSIAKNGIDNFNTEDSTFIEYGDYFVMSVLNHFPVSYSLKDLEGNGVSELLIWGDDDYLSAAYTTVNNEVKPLGFSHYRSTLALDDDSTFYGWGSGGAYSGIYEIYKMSNDGSSLIITDSYTYEYGETDKFSKYENVSGDFFNRKEMSDLVQVSEEEFKNVQQAESAATYSGERHYF